MRFTGLLLAAALAAPAFAAAPAPRPREFTELAAGRYSVALTGLVSSVCGRAIASELAKLPEIESASVDYDKSAAVIAVRIGSTMKVASMQKALRRAEKVANLGARYDAREITYLLK